MIENPQVGDRVRVVGRRGFRPDRQTQIGDIGVITSVGEVSPYSHIGASLVVDFPNGECIGARAINYERVTDAASTAPAASGEIVLGDTRAGNEIQVPIGTKVRVVRNGTHSSGRYADHGAEGYVWSHDSDASFSIYERRGGNSEYFGWVFPGARLVILENADGTVPGAPTTGITQADLDKALETGYLLGLARAARKHANWCEDGTKAALIQMGLPRDFPEVSEVRNRRVRQVLDSKVTHGNIEPADRDFVISLLPVIKVKKVVTIEVEVDDTADDDLAQAVAYDVLRRGDTAERVRVSDAS